MPLKWPSGKLRDHMTNPNNVFSLNIRTIAGSYAWFWLWPKCPQRGAGTVTGSLGLLARHGAAAQEHNLPPRGDVVHDTILLSAPVGGFWHLTEPVFRWFETSSGRTTTTPRRRSSAPPVSCWTAVTFEQLIYNMIIVHTQSAGSPSTPSCIEIVFGSILLPVPGSSRLPRSVSRSTRSG